MIDIIWHWNVFCWALLERNRGKETLKKPSKKTHSSTVFLFKFLIWSLEFIIKCISEFSAYTSIYAIHILFSSNYTKYHMCLLYYSGKMWAWYLKIYFYMGLMKYTLFIPWCNDVGIDFIVYRLNVLDTQFW